MGSGEKAVRKLLAGAANKRLDEVLAALDTLGFDCYRDGLGHWQCHHLAAGVSVTVCPPHGGRSKVLAAYVRAAQQAAKRVLAWQAEQESDDADTP